MTEINRDQSPTSASSRDAASPGSTPIIAARGSDDGSRQSGVPEQRGEVVRIVPGVRTEGGDGGLELPGQQSRQAPQLSGVRLVGKPGQDGVQRPRRLPIEAPSRGRSEPGPRVGSCSFVGGTAGVG